MSSRFVMQQLREAYAAHKENEEAKWKEVQESMRAAELVMRLRGADRLGELLGYDGLPYTSDMANQYGYILIGDYVVLAEEDRKQANILRVRARYWGLPVWDTDPETAADEDLANEWETSYWVHAELDTSQAPRVNVVKLGELLSDVDIRRDVISKLLEHKAREAEIVKSSLPSYDEQRSSALHILSTQHDPRVIAGHIIAHDQVDQSVVVQYLAVGLAKMIQAQNFHGPKIDILPYVRSSIAEARGHMAHYDTLQVSESGTAGAKAVKALIEALDHLARFVEAV